MELLDGGFELILGDETIAIFQNMFLGNPYVIHYDEIVTQCLDEYLIDIISEKLFQSRKNVAIFESGTFPAERKTKIAMSKSAKSALKTGGLKPGSFAVIKGPQPKIKHLAYGVIGYGFVSGKPGKRTIINPQPLWVYRIITDKKINSKKQAKDITKIYNPPIIIRSIESGNIELKIIDDAKLIGGTKQRAIVPLMRQVPENILVYASPPQGFAQVALSYSAKLARKKAVIFTTTFSKDRSLAKLARKINPETKIIYKKAGLGDIEKMAAQYAVQKSAFLVPFGLRFEGYSDLLSTSIVSAWPVSVPHPSRIWVPLGSGALLTSLYKAFPSAYFIPVQVGRRVYGDVIDHSRTKWPPFIAPERFAESAKVPPPYTSNTNYDAKMWQFIIQHGQTGDYVWNVAA